MSSPNNSITAGAVPSDLPPPPPGSAAASGGNSTTRNSGDGSDETRIQQQQKRPASATRVGEEGQDSSDDGATKRQRQEEEEEKILYPAPIYLFATATDVQARRGQNRNHWSRKQCLTLREMLGIGDNFSSRLDNEQLQQQDTVSMNMGSIDFLLIANYIINFEFILDECPELLSLPRAVCIYGSKEGTEDAWRQACTTLDGQCSVDFLCRSPSDDKGSSTNPLEHKIPLGMHHTKLFVIGFTSELLRVVIHTANLRFSDIHHKAQGAYIQDFPKKQTSNATTTATTSDFEESLINYLESYKYNKQHKWDDSNSTTATATTLTAHLRKYDFSSARVTLIPSVPGYHKLTSSTSSNDNSPSSSSAADSPAARYGHLKVRKEVATLRRNTTTAAAAAAAAAANGPITFQFSSIGSLSKKFLQRLAYSMDAGRTSIVSHSASATNIDEDDDDDDNNNDESSSKPLNNNRLRLVYPTSDEICNCLEGYRGGNSVPGHKKNVSKEFLRPLFHKWAASVSFLSSLSLTRKDDSSKENPLWKGTNVPHIKSYFQLSNETDDSMEWFMIGSQNLSKAAWGDVQDFSSKTFGEKRFCIRHWELGVFLSPAHLNANRLVPWTPDRDRKREYPRDETIPLPYRVRPIQYTASDKPWAVDERYVRLDIFGRRSASDA